MQKEIVWAEVLAEAENYKDGLADLVYENSCRPGFIVRDENGDKVTVASWSRKLKIGDDALRSWIKNRRSEGINRGTSDQSSTQSMAARALKALPVGTAATTIVEAIRSNTDLALQVENDLHPPVERDPALMSTIESIGDSTRITGPLGRLLNVAWEVSQKVAEITRFRSDERDYLLDTADKLRFYADQYEMLGRAELSPADFSEGLGERP